MECDAVRRLLARPPHPDCGFIARRELAPIFATEQATGVLLALFDGQDIPPSIAPVDERGSATRATYPKAGDPQASGTGGIGGRIHIAFLGTDGPTGRLSPSFSSRAGPQCSGGAAVRAPRRTVRCSPVWPLFC